MENTVFTVTGMSCDHCVRSVREAIESVPGVKGADVSLAAGTATVSHEGPLDVAAVVRAVEDEEFGIAKA